MAERKKPLRTCVACGETNDKRELIRIVKESDGTVSVDEKGKKPGRGAYIHANDACFEITRRRRGLDRSLRISLTEADYDRLEEQFNNSVRLHSDAQIG